MPDKHPIVERPEYLWDPGLSLIFESEREHIIRYIEWLEGRLSFDQERNMDLHKCQAENRRLESAIREKDNRLEKLWAEHDALQTQFHDMADKTRDHRIIGDANDDSANVR